VPGPLSGFWVLDLSRILAGPWASQMLADLGAEVIKIERPGSGDDTRAWGPPFLTAPDGSATQESAYFLAANRGKRSVAIDFCTPEGQRLVQALAAKSDVLIENYKVGGLQKYGLDYASLSAADPKLIYCSITGFGQTGPLATRPGYDFLLQGMGGLMSITGEPDGEPQKVGVAVVDILTGLYACSAILAALVHRQATGQGQWIDLALLDVQIATLANQASSFLVSGEQPRRLGNAHPSIVPYEAYPTSDGYIIVAVGNDEQFARFAAAVGEPSLARDQQFATNPARVRNRDALKPILRALLAGQPTEIWLTVLGAAGVPCGPVNGVRAALDEPQVQARGMLHELQHPTAGRYRSIGSPMRFSATPVEDDRAAPLLGADTDHLLQEVLGIAGAELIALRQAGVLGKRPELPVTPPPARPAASPASPAPRSPPHRTRPAPGP
jgi:crotonobetainyl-CoA:carnitine CoA-transferase CaiB-like acyl-CoA transferase